MALVYGYVPYLILPLFASLDRIDQRMIEAARDLGAPPISAFWRVVVPLSRPGLLAGIVLIALPMFGDFYTPDLISGSPRTSMLGNTINNQIQGGPDKSLGSALTIVLSAFLLILMIWYVRSLRAEQKAEGARA
jgi:spermidine/putrescine transport system permease protein